MCKTKTASCTTTHCINDSKYNTTVDNTLTDGIGKATVIIMTSKVMNYEQ